MQKGPHFASVPGRAARVSGPGQKLNPSRGAASAAPYGDELRGPDGLIHLYSQGIRLPNRAARTQ